MDDGHLSSVTVPLKSRPQPSQATIPSLKTKRSMRRENRASNVAVSASSHPSSGPGAINHSHHGNGSSSEGAPPTSAVIQQVKQKQRRKQKVRNSHHQQQQHQPVAYQFGETSPTQHDSQDWSQVVEGPPRLHAHSNGAVTAAEHGLALLSNFFTSLVKKGETSTDSHQAASNDSSASFLPPHVSRRFNGEDAIPPSSSFESDDDDYIDGPNHDDNESEYEFASDLSTRFGGRQLGDHEADYEADEHAIPGRRLQRARRSSSKKKRYHTQQQQQQPLSSPTAQRIPCKYAEFGCETLVPPAEGAADAHYHSAYAHHLSLLHAKHSIVASQKTQLSQQVDQSHQAVELLHRKLEHRERKYNKLRLAFERKRAALKEIRATHNLQDLIAEYILGSEGATERKTIAELTAELAGLKTELATKDKLLIEAAEYMKAMSVESKSDSSPSPHATVDRSPTPAFTSSPVLSPAVAPAPDVTVTTPPFLPTSPAITPLSPSLQPAVTGAFAVPISSLPPNPLNGYHKAPPPPRPLISAVQQAHNKAMRAKPQSASETKAQAARESMVYYAVPHPALKALAPHLNTAVLSSIFSAIPAGSTSPPQIQSAISTARPQSAESASDAASRGAKLGLTGFCPQTWLKKAYTSNSTISASQTEGK